MRKVHGTLIVGVCCLMFASAQLNAQVTYDGCRDALGRAVASVRNDNLRDVAMATLVNGQPVIVYNTIVLSWYNPQTRLFWYGHECGHHALGHAFGANPLGREQQADCFGIVSLVRNGLIRDDEVGIIQSDLARSGPGDWEHLPGPVRGVNLRACLNAAGDERERGSDGNDPESVDVDMLEDVDESGDVYVSDFDIDWDSNPNNPVVRYEYELTNDGERARCQLRVHVVLIDRDTDEPIRVHNTRTHRASVPADDTRRISGSMRWYGDNRVMPGIRSQLSCRT